MKKILIAFALLAGFAACQREEFVPEDAQQAYAVRDSYAASSESSQTRTAMDGLNVIWSENDKVAVFENTDALLAYTVSSGAGTTVAELGLTSGNAASGSDIGSVVAYYPYASDVACSKNDAASLNVDVTLPSVQNYAEDSFGPGAFPMAAVSDISAESLSFKNVSGALKLSLTGSVKVKSITLRGNEGEPVAGNADVTVWSDGESVPAVEMAADAVSYVTLDCGSGVQLGSEAVSFVIAVPPTKFESGFTVTVTDAQGMSMEIRTDNPQEIKRNTVLKMPVKEYEAAAVTRDGLSSVPEIPNADEPMTLYYKAPEGSVFDGYSKDLYAHIGVLDGEWKHVVSNWDVDVAKCKFQKTSQENVWMLKIEPSVREYFNSGTTPLNVVAVVVRDAKGAGDRQTEDLFINVYDPVYGSGEAPTPLPEGVQHGINIIDDSTVTLVLLERDNSGSAYYDECYLIGTSFGGWARKEKYKMNRDEAAGCWWITLTDLYDFTEYYYQYELVKGDSSVKVHDPYSEIVYDMHHDQWTSAANKIKSIRTKTDGLVSSFQILETPYSWKYPDYQIEDEDDLVIYEMLFRDFTTEQSVSAAIERLDYIADLGVNAVEIMPIQEFEGNDSWGYAPHSYFAMDKYYGSSIEYKKFIDACHERGLAVILDVVYNHATGAHPMAKMYWDGDKTAENNPWFNRIATHGDNVYHDWNHSSTVVRNHFKRNLEYLLEEYKVDGFRFDLSKGFIQSGNEYSWNQERTNWIKEYYNTIKKADPNAVVILEHWVDDENYDLCNYGMKVWSKYCEPYAETAMGWQSDKTSFEGVREPDWLPFGSYVAYMESHDEERMCFSQKEYGNGSAKTDLAVRMRRAGLNAAFFFTVPGVKMIWQFGEIGYDYSINYNDGRTAAKPVVTDEYMADPDRKALYDTYAGLLEFRKNNPRFFDNDSNFRWGVGTSNWPGRYIMNTSKEGKTYAIFGNFGSGNQAITMELPSDGPWYNYYNSSEVWNGKSHKPTLKEGEYVFLVDDKSMCKQ